MTKVFGLLALSVSLVFFTGCGASKPTGTLSGTVTDKDGNPVAAQISFKGETSTASAMSDPTSGAYTLMDGMSPNIVAGKYQISVSQVSEEADPEGTNYEALMAGGDTATPTKSAIPAKYAGFSTSGLETTVTEGENTYDIKLE